METCNKIVCTLLWEQEVLIQLKLVLGEEVMAEMLIFMDVHEEVAFDVDIRKLAIDTLT